MKNIEVYLICPVRNVTKEQQLQLDEYVKNLESNKYNVHYPPRDVKQDQEGYSILAAHRHAMRYCDEVHIWWDKDSKGSHFDLGMAFMLRLFMPITLKFVVANDIQKTEHKSFENVMLQLADLDKENSSPDEDEAKNEIKRRYLRETYAHPSGAVVHYADCNIYSADECTAFGGCDCGLHRDLMVLSDETIKEVYPKYFTELL